MPAVKITLTAAQWKVLEEQRAARGLPAGTLARLWMYSGAALDLVNMKNPGPETDPSQLNIFRKPGGKTAGKSARK